MLRSSSLFYLVAFLSVPLLVSCDDKLTEGVDIADIPTYYFDNNYLDDKAKAINDAIAECTDGCETFFWITDIHWEPDLNARKAPLLIKYIASKTGINKILNGGDTGNSQVICKNAITQLKNAIGSDKVYTVTGNHEIVDASRYERPFRRVADELRGHCSDIVYGNDDNSYFYFEDIRSETRYIGLSSFGLYLNNECESCYTTEQLEWFKNTALDVPSGWFIVIFTHSMYYVEASTNKLITTPSGASAFIDAINDYKGKGQIVSVLMGHSHIDRLHKGKTGVPYIITACDRRDSYHGDINVSRIPETISEQHFEVVVIDKGKKQIKLFSVGANARDGYDNDPGKETDARIVSY